MMAMFGGHIPEEPVPPRGNFGDFGMKLDPKKMADALKDSTVNEAAITRAAGRVLYEIVHFGYLDGQSKHEVTAQSSGATGPLGGSAAAGDAPDPPCPGVAAGAGEGAASRQSIARGEDDVSVHTRWMGVPLGVGAS